MNKLIITGNLGKDPNMRYTNDGKAIVEFSVAVSGYNKRTDWFTVSAWNKTAEACNKYLSKGDKVLVEGSMQEDKWTGDDGQEHRRWKVVASNVEFLNTKPKEETKNDYPF